MRTTLTTLIFCILSSFSTIKADIWDTGHGLSSSKINHLLTDEHGLIWISTEFGLNIFDGLRFTTFLKNDECSNTLLNNNVNIVFHSHDDIYLIGSNDGLQRFDFATNRFSRICTILLNGNDIKANINKVIRRADGTLTISASGHGLFILGNGSDSALQIPNNPSYFINDMSEDPDHDLWILSLDRGTMYTDSLGNTTSVNDENGKTITLPSAICHDEQGNSYIGSLAGGLHIYNKQQRTTRSIKPLSACNIKSLIYHDGKVYIGTDGQGLWAYTPATGTTELLTLDTQTLNDTKAKVHAITFDGSGNMWLGLFQKGVYSKHAGEMTFGYIGQKSVKHNTIGCSCVMSVCQASGGLLYVGCDNDGLYVLDCEYRQLRHYPASGHAYGIPATIMALHEDREGYIWMGAYNQGLSRLDPRTGQIVHIKGINRADRTAMTASVFSITEDDKGTIWAGSHGAGVFAINKATLEAKQLPMLNNGIKYTVDLNVMNNSWVNTVLMSDDKSRLYIGTMDGVGCYDIANKSFVSAFGKNRLLEGAMALSMIEDNDTLWVGTSNNLTAIDLRTLQITEYRSRHGLPHNIVNGLTKDANGNIWASTTSALVRIDRHGEQISFTNYNGAYEMQGNEFSKNCLTCAPNGTIFAGGTSGITHFGAAEVHRLQQSPKPKVSITSLLINNQKVHKGMLSDGQPIMENGIMDAERIFLSHKDNSFSIEFSTMDATSAQSATYAYSLNGGEWITLGNGVSQVSFTDMPSGVHTFDLVARNSSQQSDTKRLTIEIGPQWFATTAAKISFGAIIIALFTLITIYRRRRLRMQFEMIEMANAEKMNKSRLQLFTDISHEIRTPITLVLDPITELIKTDTDPARSSNYKTIYRNSQRILNIVNQLMDLRKIDEEKMTLIFSPADIVGTIRDICEQFDFQAKQRKINISVDASAEAICAYIDLGNFDKIIVNLLSNALKFTPQGGDITIHIRQHSDKYPQGYAEIAIEDNGTGISSDNPDQVFDSFYQEHNATNRQYTGSGVGLHLTRSLVQMHHGHISVANNEGKPGCCFTIELPLGKEHLANELVNETAVKETTDTDTIETNDDTETKTASKSRTVLIAEDDQEIRQYLSRRLAAWYKVIEATNGKEALDIAHRERLDIIVSDIMMPETDGLTLCRKIKQNINLNHIPVVLLTAMSQDRDRIKGLEYGADAYITKPFNFDVLKKSIDNVIENHERLRNIYKGEQKQHVEVNLSEPTSNEKMMQRLRDFVTRNISNPDLNIEMITREVGISRVHLYRKTKELTNQTPRDFVRNIRLQEAAKLLAEKNYNISRVAELTGFNNAQYFATAFKEMYGMTPTEYMNAHNKKE